MPNVIEKARTLGEKGDLDSAILVLKDYLNSPSAELTETALRAEVLIELGRVYLAQQNGEGAARVFEQALELDPSRGDIHYQLGLLHLAAVDPASAVARLEAARVNGFENLAVLMNLFQAYFAASRPSDAVHLFHEITATNPQSAQVHFQLGKLLFEHLFYERARKAFLAALERDPDSYEIRFYFAMTDYLLERFDETIRTLEPLAASSPTPEVFNLLGSACGRLERFDAAAQWFHRAIDQAPQRADAYFNLALLYLETGREEEAEQLLTAVRDMQENTETKVFYTLTNHSCAALEKEILKPLVTPDKDGSSKSDYYYSLALQFQRRYHHGTAVEFFNLARKYGRHDADLLTALGLSCLNLEPLSSTALSFILTAIELKPQSAENYFLLGQAYSRRNQDAEALRAYQRAVDLEPGRAAYHYELGKALATSGTAAEGALKVEDSVQAFRRALEVSPQHAASHYELGKIYLRLNELQKAVSHLENCLQLEPDFYECYYLLGRIYAKMGQSERADRHFQLFAEKEKVIRDRATAKGGFVTAR